MKIGRDYQLIVTIIKKGFAERVVNAAKAAGARGGTILHGRGVGIHEQKTAGNSNRTRKDIILTLIHQDQTKTC